MNALWFSTQLFGLTFLYALVFGVVGNALLDERRRRAWGILHIGVGFLLVYPVAVVLVSLFAPSVAAVVGVLALGALWILIVRRPGGHPIGRLLDCGRQAGAIALLGVLFWLPGAVGQHVGFFSESGGDFTIYAGLPDAVGDAPLWRRDQIIRVMTTWEPADDTGNLLLIARSPRAKPPRGDWGAQGVIEASYGERYAGWLGLQHFLSVIGFGDAAVRFLALEATLWAILCAAAAQVARTLGGWRCAIPMLAVFAGSHALAGVGYNHYLPQLLASVMITVLLAVVLLPPALRPSAASAVCAAMFVTAMICIAYYPMLPVVALPVLALIFAYGPLNVCVSLGRRHVLLALALGALVLPYALVQIQLIVMMVRRIAGDAGPHGRRTIDFLGPPQPYDLQQVAAFFGAYSVQWLPSRTGIDLSTAPATLLVVVTGVMLLGFAAVAAIKLQGGHERRALLALGGSLLIAGPILLWLGRSYEYTQFKALAYLAPAVLLLVGLVPALFRQRVVVTIATALVVLMAGGLATHRVEGMLRIAREIPPTGILDVRLSGLLAAIRERDPDAFVLADAPGGAVAQWDFALREAPRALLLPPFRYPEPHASYISLSDAPHLWIVRHGQIPHDAEEGLSDGDLIAFRPSASHHETLAGLRPYLAVDAPGVQPGASVTVSWRGMALPTSTDWIGVFPKGGPNEARIAFGFTAGVADGSQSIQLPSDLAPGDYEVRLFPAGSWSALASTPFTVLAVN